MVEQLICNQQVVGSTPIGGSMVFLAGITYNENNPPQVDQRIMQTCKKAPNPCGLSVVHNWEKLI